MNKKKSSISKKLIITVIVSFIVIIASVFVSFFTIINGLLYDNLNDELTLKAQANTDNINATISGYMSDIAGFVFDLENTTDRSEATIKNAIDKKVAAFPSGVVSAFYVAYGGRNYLYETLGWVPNADYTVSDRSWYTSAISSQGLHVLTYEDANTGIYAMCISTQIQTDTGEQAVLAIDLILSSTFEENRMKSSTEYFFIEDSDGKIIFHPNTSFMPGDGKITLTQDAAESYQTLKSLASGTSATIRDYDGESYVFTVNEIPNGGFRVYTGIQTKTVSDEIARILMIGIIIVVLLLAAVSVVLVLFIRRLITNPLGFASKYISDIAATGDLSIADERAAESRKYLSQNDEISDTLSAANRLFDMMQSQGRMLGHIADKDLSHTVEPLSERSTIDLIAAHLLDELNETMSAIQSSSAQVSSGARQIAGSSQELAQGAAAQSSAIEQLSTSISDVSETTRVNADMANRAATLAVTIKGNAEKGSEQMSGMVNAVREINEASSAISKVIKVIDDIAFQTNILALNAAVEAARAGVHGKGFAVVAEEVRNLASKSAEAAKDTSSLIENSIEKASLGEKIAGETAASLTEIVTGINESSAIISDIAKYSGEQESSISKINDGIEQIADVIHQTSATSEESAASAEEMSSQAQLLAQAVAQFKLGGNAANTPQSKPASSGFRI